MDPNQLLAQISQQVRAIADEEANKAYVKAKHDMMIGFVFAVVASVLISKVWK